jgi:hypothetical protein
VRLEHDQPCTLVLIGARPDGRKELIAIEDGYRDAPRAGPRCYAISRSAAYAPLLSQSAIAEWGLDGGARGLAQDS